MKAFLLLFVSITSFAAGKTYSYSAKLLNSDSLASNCPNYSKTEITINDEKNANGYIYIDGNEANAPVMLSYTGESRSCLSDILCPTSVTFGNETHYSKIVLTRNNDGNYPTTNLEGFSDLTFDLSETPRFGSYYCRYDLTVAY